jgi:SAM-dependent methyltransferase
MSEIAMFRQLRRLPAELHARIASAQPTIRGLNDGMSYWSYKRALDLGCGLGNLTRRLCNHADQVLGIDVSHVAIAQATQEGTEQSNLQFQQGDALNLSRDLDNGFDLVVIADTLYYLSPLSDEVLQTVRERVVQLLVPRGILLLVNHYTLNFDPGSRWSPKIHQVFRSAPAFTTIHESRRPFYLASVFEKSL